MRKLSATLGFLCLFGAAGTDQHYAEMGQVPPEGVGQLIIVGLILLIPAIFIKRKAKK